MKLEFFLSLHFSGQCSCIYLPFAHKSPRNTDTWCSPQLPTLIWLIFSLIHIQRSRSSNWSRWPMFWPGSTKPKLMTMDLNFIQAQRARFIVMFKVRNSYRAVPGSQFQPLSTLGLKSLSSLPWSHISPAQVRPCTCSWKLVQAQHGPILLKRQLN